MPDPRVAGLIKDNFVAVKMDMEHGEGVKIAMKYHISGYPTFMFFSPEGRLVYLSVGYQKPDRFLAELNNAMAKDKQVNAPGYSETIDIDYPEFYKKAFAENGKKAFPKPEEVTKYLDGQKDKFSEVSWAVISRFGLNAKYNRFFFDNIAKYTKLYGAAGVDDKVDNILYAKLTDAIKAKSEKQYAEVLRMTDRYVKEDKAGRKDYYTLTFYKGIKNWKKYGPAVKKHVAKMNVAENPEAVNELCWNLYENCDDKALLTDACSYMTKVIDGAPAYAYMDTYAALLYKTGQLDQAATWAKKAIEEGKKKGENVSETEKLLNKITGGK